MEVKVVEKVEDWGEGVREEDLVVFELHAHGHGDDVPCVVRVEFGAVKALKESLHYYIQAV